MDQFLASCNAAAEYPKNLIRSNTYAFVTQSYFDRLNERQSELFNIPEKAALDFWEFGDSAAAFCSQTIRTLDALRTHLCLEVTDRRRDPKCRFIFVQAPHSRERLYTTRYMLALLLTYQQVIPVFLDFLFLFGKQVNERGFHFGGFRYQSRILNSERGLEVSELGWSGRDYKLCFNLRSVERASGGGEPWSIRQAAIHHSFDVVSGQASWIVIKANKVLQDRIRSATGPQGMSKSSSYQEPDRAFVSTLATHLIFCQWSGENWRWYIDYLEETLQETTKRTLSPNFWPSNNPNEEPTWSPKSHPMYADAQEMSDLARGRQPPQSTDAETSMYDSSKMLACLSGPEFSFMDLQRTQHLEEKAPAAPLILKNNISVLADLEKHYRTLSTSHGWPGNLITHCGEDILRFEQDLSSIRNDMLLQISRVETLLQLIADRKSLLYGILNSQNIEANKISTATMLRMTADMHEIAVKTKQEPISMRIITFVTLCFLPGTFISTLMSTDIIKFQNKEAGPFMGSFSLGALGLYLIISVPLVAFTLLVWWLFYRREIPRNDQPSRQERPGRFVKRWRLLRSRLGRSCPSPLPT